MAGRRLEFGFEGGTALRVTVPEDEAEGLAVAAEAGEGWIRVDSEEGDYRLNTGKLLYVRLAPGAVPSSVGFGGA